MRDEGERRERGGHPVRPLSARAAATASLMAIITCRTKKRGQNGQTQSGQTQVKHKVVKRNGSNATGPTRRLGAPVAGGRAARADRNRRRTRLPIKWSNTCGQIHVVKHMWSNQGVQDERWRARRQAAVGKWSNDTIGQNAGVVKVVKSSDQIMGGRAPRCRG